MEPFLGEIRLFAGNFAPRGWALCYGQLLSISQNAALFSLLGTTYGGDGRTTFGLPDLRGRVPVHEGQGPGLTPRTLGERSGSEAVTLLATQLPAHTHALAASTANATSQVARGNLPAFTYVDAVTTLYANEDGGTVAMAPGAIAPTGSGLPHENRMPTLALNFIIAVEGIYPSRP